MVIQLRQAPVKQWICGCCGGLFGKKIATYRCVMEDALEKLGPLTTRELGIIAQLNGERDSTSYTAGILREMSQRGLVRKINGKWDRIETRVDAKRGRE